MNVGMNACVVVVGVGSGMPPVGSCRLLVPVRCSSRIGLGSCATQVSFEFLWRDFCERRCELYVVFVFIFVAAVFGVWLCCGFAFSCRMVRVPCPRGIILVSTSARPVLVLHFVLTGLAILFNFYVDRLWLPFLILC